MIGRALLMMCLLQSGTLFAAKHPPLPWAIERSRTICLKNLTSDNATLNQVFQKLEQWGRWQIVGDGEDADLVIALGSDIIAAGTTVNAGSTTIGGSTIYSGSSFPMIAAFRSLIVIDQKHHSVLMSVSTPLKINSRMNAGALVKKLRNQIGDE